MLQNLLEVPSTVVLRGSVPELLQEYTAVDTPERRCLAKELDCMPVVVVRWLDRHWVQDLVSTVQHKLLEVLVGPEFRMVLAEVVVAK